MASESARIIQRIRFPKSPETQELYLRSDRAAGAPSANAGDTISLNTYFNSFFEKHYARYTHLDSFYYLLKLEGDFKVKLCRENVNNEKEVLRILEFRDCTAEGEYKIELPRLSQHKGLHGRLYLELEALGDKSLFRGGVLAAEAEPIEKVSLGIIICTYQREDFVKNTVKTILADESLAKEDIKIFIVDNGNTLRPEDLAYEKVQLIPNKNTGGSGGFSRGLVEGLKEKRLTHFLVMDDDIEIESEVVFRLFSIYGYARPQVGLLLGAYLDLDDKRRMVHGAGNFRKAYGKFFDFAHYNPDSRITEPRPLNDLLMEESPEWGGFWFAAFSREAVLKLGLLMPYFLYMDDVEFCLRVRQSLGKEIICFPPLSVWHRPFQVPGQPMSWRPFYAEYYNWRNRLITGSLGYTGVFSESYWCVARALARIFLSDMKWCRYLHAFMLTSAIRDYLKGPDFIRNNRLEDTHALITQMGQRYESRLPARFQNLASEHPIWKTRGRLRKGLCWLRSSCNRFAIKCTLDFIVLIVRGYFVYGRLSEEWRRSAPELRSVEYWRRYYRESPAQSP